MAEVAQQYRVINPSSLEDLTNQVNRIFAQIADRTDGQEGRRGAPKFYADVDMGGNRGTNAASAVNLGDLTPLAQLSTEVSSQVSAQIASILTYNKPIGTIHMTTTAANPATYLGYGTWVAFGAGKVIVGINPADTDFDTVEETGGSKTASIGSHAHDMGHTHPAGTLVDVNGDGTTAQVNDGAYVGNTGTGTGTISVVQPYIVVYVWKRTA